MPSIVEMDDVVEYLTGQPITIACGFVALLLILRLVVRSNPEAPVPFTVPIPEQCQDNWKGEILNEPSIKISGSTAIQCYAPATGQLLGLVNPSTPEGIDRAITRAEQAQKDWALTNFSQRRRVLRTLLKFVLENQESLAKVACLDSGKTRVDAVFGELLVTAEKLQWTIKHGEEALRKSTRPTNLLMMYKRNEVWYEPLGVVAACVSWNYPVHNLFGPIISSLFTGNAIIVKSSEQVAWSSNYLIQIVQTALKSCGHSPWLAQSLVCWPQTAGHLTSHPKIAHITFIGSRSVAHQVAASAAKSLTPLLVELGGKDASILLESTPKSDLSRIVQILMRGVFISAGQNCIGIERILAHECLYETLISKLEPLVKGLRVGWALDPEDGDTIDVGASISSVSFDRLEGLISDAVSRGARLLVGGKRHMHSKYPQGHYFSPTLIVDVTPDMPIAQTELFAPIALVMKATSTDHAIELANGTAYGLGCSVFGRPSDPALKTVTSSVRAGMVAVNDFGATYMVQLPFGGVGGSGYGRFAGEEGLRGLCNAKSVCVDRVWGVKTSIPPELHYPVKSAKGAFRVAAGVVKVGYGQGLGGKIGGLREILGL